MGVSRWKKPLCPPNVSAETVAMVRWGMVIDLKRCNGNGACTVACKAEQATPPGIWYAPVIEKETGKFPNAKRLFLPVLCNHCKDPPCLQACPSGAIVKRQDGIVHVEDETCIGSRACIAACPYGAMFFDDQQEGYFAPGLTPFEQAGYPRREKGVAMKCNFCVHRIDKGLQPACVETCPTRARIVGDLDDPESEASQMVRARPNFVLRPECKTDPSVIYLV